jgi:anti-sigma factor RsiW
MDCERAQDLIEREADEALPETEAADLQAHLDGCAACSRHAEETKQLLCQLRDRGPAEADEAVWRECLRKAVPEGTGRLRQRRDLRTVRRLAWATAAVWVLAWLVGRGVHAPSLDAALPTPAVTAADAADLYHGLPLRATPPTLSPTPRRVAIERLLSGAEPDDESRSEAGPEPPERGPRAEVSNRA